MSYLEAAMGIEPMNKGFAKISRTVDGRTPKAKEVQRETFSQSSCSPLVSGTCRCLLHFYYSDDLMRSALDFTVLAMWYDSLTVSLCRKRERPC